MESGSGYCSFLRFQCMKIIFHDEKNNEKAYSKKKKDCA